MKIRKLGQHGPDVSVIGYGAMSFTNFYGPATVEGSCQILEACLDMGITHIDTADAYGLGHSETVIGDWLKARKGENPFTIASKVGITNDPDQRLKNNPEHLEKSLDDSLSRLGIDALDLYYVHRRDDRFEIEDVTETLAGFVKAGKIKAFGFSEIAPSSLRRAHAVHPVAAVQSEYSLSTRAPELGLLQTCKELGASMVAFSPVGRGLLTNRPHSLGAIAEMPWMKTNPRFNEPHYSLNLEYNVKFQNLAADMGIAAATLAVAWLVHQGEHILPIPGTRHVQHLAEVAAGGTVDLSEEDLNRIETVLPAGWAHGDRYSVAQWVGPERYC